MGTSEILIVQNDETEGLGLYQRYLEEEGVSHDVFHAYDMKLSGVFPSVDDYDAFIIGPTPLSANEYRKHDFLRREWRLLGEIIERGKPCFGVCCGAQLLAKRLGAAVKRSPQREVGGYEVWLTEEGKRDQLFAGFPPRFQVFHWHRDMFEVPTGGKLLVEGSPCPIHAFGLGSVRGVIFHLEVDSREAERWADAYPAEIYAVGKTRERVIRECREREPEMKALAHRLIENFLNFAR